MVTLNILVMRHKEGKVKIKIFYYLKESIK